MAVGSYYLGGCLSKMSYLSLESYPLIIICHLVQIKRVLIGKMIEDVHFRNSLFSPLFLPEHQINPPWYVLRDCLWLKCPPYGGYKHIRVSLRPFGNHYIINALFRLSHPIVIVIYINVQLRDYVEVRNELSHVTGWCSSVHPALLIVGEHSVSNIKFPTLQWHGPIRVGFEPNEEVADDSRWAVVGTIVIFWKELVFVLWLVLLDKIFLSWLGAQCPHILS